MKKIKFIQINKENEKQFQQLLSMWIPYFKEIGSTESDSMITKYARQRVNIQGNREDMHFELCFDDSILIGFCFYAVDLGGIKGILPPNLGYIMEFYVLPQYRRQGYGSEMFKHIEKTFLSHSIESMYLTPDEVNGKLFWCSLGFVDSGKIDPDNHSPIYIKKVEIKNNMKQIEFVLVNRNNPDNCLDFMRLGYEYMRETASDYPLQIHEKFLNSILNKQSENNRWLILLKVDTVSVGFVHAKIDKDEKVDWGYIMEFYINPSYRRNGLGTYLYNFIKQKFISCEIKNIWLAADKTTGEPFWFSIGFMDTGELENEHKVLEVSI
jgi:GNAT superfamily N-acetyltransferase